MNAISVPNDLLLPTVQNVHLSATNADEMQLSQRTMTDWFAARMKQAKSELDLAQANLDAAEAGGYKLSAFKSALRRMRHEVTFYEKCCAASQAGHALVPTFPVDVFAIRTVCDLPAEMRDSRRWLLREQEHDKNLAIGEGMYVDALPKIGFHHTDTRWNEQKKEHENRDIFYAESFQEVDFPECVRHPAVITAVSDSMDMAIFDDYGVLPSRRRKGDPIVVGRIHRPKGSRPPMCFLIAWYIDTRTL